MKDSVKALLQQSLAQLVANETIAEFSADIRVDQTKDKNHGDLATNIALMLAKPNGLNPRQLAEQIIEQLPENTVVDRCDIAGPGFINFFVAQSSQFDAIAKVLDQNESYGVCDQGKKEKVQVEFVSANPTGPLHVGHGRGAAVGDSLCRLLSAAGWDVTREFYYNDAGQQINNLTLSVQLRAKGITPEDSDWPEDGYRGDYIIDIANSYKDKTLVNGVQASGDTDNIENLRAFSVAYLRREQDLDLKAFDVGFDVFSLESALYTDGEVEAAVQSLINNGFTYEKDDALWLKTTDFGDDKDRVMRKSNGGYTYFVPDVAYHLEKWQRGFKKVVNEQGADHHSTITRVRAGLQALQVDIPEGWPDYVLHQMVTVTKGGQEVKISKRAGSYVTLRDLIDQVGKDATRFFLVSRRVESQLVFDIDLALQQSNENPVYYIQYAHARLCSAAANAKVKFDGVDIEQGLQHLDQLGSESEADLAKLISAYPEKLANAARDLTPHTIAKFLQEFAAAVHSWYASGNQDRSLQLLVDDTELRNARLALAAAAAQVIRNGLDILGVSAPESM